MQNITLEDTITYKERIRGSLNRLQYLKVTNCESRQHMAPLENLFNVICQDLSRQFGSSDPRVAVFKSFFTWNFFKYFYLECNSRYATSLEMDFETTGARIWNNFSKISNDELDNLIRDYRNIHGLPCDRSTILGHLNLKRKNVHQKRVMESLDRWLSHAIVINYLERKV